MKLYALLQISVISENLLRKKPTFWVSCFRGEPSGPIMELTIA